MTAFAYEVHDHLLDNEDADPESDEVQAVPVCCSSQSLASALQWHNLYLLRLPAHQFHLLIDLLCTFGAGSACLAARSQAAA